MRRIAVRRLLLLRHLLGVSVVGVAVLVVTGVVAAVRLAVAAGALGVVGVGAHIVRFGNAAIATSVTFDRRRCRRRFRPEVLLEVLRHGVVEQFRDAGQIS